MCGASEDGEPRPREEPIELPGARKTRRTRATRNMCGASEDGELRGATPRKTGAYKCIREDFERSCNKVDHRRSRS